MKKGETAAGHLLALFCVGAVGTHARYVAPRPYAWLLGAITATMVLVQAAVTPAGLFEFALNRTAEIVTGVICAALVAMADLDELSGLEPEHGQHQCGRRLHRG